MNLFHTTTYNLYEANIETNYKIALISDIHFSYLITEKKLTKLTNYLEYINPDYILIPGDLIDSVDMIENTNEQIRLLNWLRRLGNIAPTIISIGSHDFFQKEYCPNSKNKRKFHWKYYINTPFFEKINNLPNVYVLDNQFFEDEKLYIAGITNSFEYYQTKYKLKKKEIVIEDKQTLLKELNDIKSELLQNLPKEKINLAMIHSPVHLTDLEVEKKLTEFDYLISGHMHNGCVPPILYEFWQSDRGFISPNKSFFPKNERNTLKKQEDKLLVTGPVTMFHECSRPMPIFNILYPTYVSIINFTNDKNYNQKKLNITKKYINYKSKRI